MGITDFSYVNPATAAADATKWLASKGASYVSSSASGAVVSVQKTIEDQRNKINAQRQLNVSSPSLFYPIEGFPKYYMNMRVTDFKRNSLSEIGYTTTVTNVALPIPLELRDTNVVEYDERPIGTVTGAAADALSKYVGGQQTGAQAVQQVGAAAAPGLLGLAGSVIGGIAGGAIAGKFASSRGLSPNGAAAAAAGGAGTGGALGGAAANLGTNLAAAWLGITPNYFLTVMLQGPRYKRYSFTWTVSPRSQQESDEIKKIITTLKNCAAPSIVGGVFFTFPNVFWLSFLPNSQYLYKFKPAVLEAITVDYAAGGAPAFYNSGAPVSMTINMVFHELEFWLNGDHNDSNDPTAITGNARQTL